jgi:CRP-like cAMP-binding protein
MAYGELFLRENEPHQYAAIALQDSHLLNLPRSVVLDALLEYPEFGLAVVQDLAMRLHKLTQRLIELEAEREKYLGAAAPERAIESTERTPAPPPPRGWWRRAARPRST